MPWAGVVGTAVAAVARFPCLETVARGSAVIVAAGAVVRMDCMTGHGFAEAAAEAAAGTVPAGLAIGTGCTNSLAVSPAVGCCSRIAGSVAAAAAEKPKARRLTHRMGSSKPQQMRFVIHYQRTSR